MAGSWMAHSASHLAKRRGSADGLALSLSIAATLVAGCGAQPCDGGEAQAEGPRVRLDVALATCNHRPVAVARIASTSRTGKDVPIELDGSGSLDADGASLRYTWRLERQEAGVTLTNATSPVAIFTAGAEGTYGVELIVSDGDLDSEPFLLEIDVRNTPPVADAGPDAPVPVGTTATLDGRNSADADDDPLTYTWVLERRPPGSVVQLDDATSPQPSFVVDQPGLYVIALTVFDGDDLSEVDRVRIGGGVTGGPPSTDAGLDAQGVTGQTYHLDGTLSTDPDNDPLTYAWRWVSLPSGSTVPPLTTTSTARQPFRPDIEGVYVAELVVDDGFYIADPDQVTVTVVPGTGLPGDVCEVAGCEAGAACFDGICVGIGRLRFSLSWEVVSDFDLHVRTPEGEEVYFGNTPAGGGDLDVDDCVGDQCRSAVHVENIVFANTPPPGRYQVWVQNYNGSRAGAYRVEVLGVARGNFTGTLPAQAGIASPRYTVIVP